MLFQGLGFFKSFQSLKDFRSQNSNRVGNYCRKKIVEMYISYDYVQILEEGIDSLNFYIGVRGLFGFCLGRKENILCMLNINGIYFCILILRRGEKN